MIRSHDIRELCPEGDTRFSPGSPVTLFGSREKTYGIVISQIESQCTVLWTKYPDPKSLFFTLPNV